MTGASAAARLERLATPTSNGAHLELTCYRPGCETPDDDVHPYLGGPYCRQHSPHFMRTGEPRPPTPPHPTRQAHYPAAAEPELDPRVQERIGREARAAIERTRA